MPIYVMLTNLTDTAKAMADPEITRHFEEEGGVLVARYTEIRPYDIVTIFEAGDNTAAAHIVSALREQGIARTVTLLGPYASPPYSAFASRFRTRNRAAEQAWCKESKGISELPTPSSGFPEFLHDPGVADRNDKETRRVRKDTRPTGRFRSGRTVASLR
ncbi:MAG: GYD domain-containing protein [Chloroflexi bacterium]|nr:GYD domain-containing protein [Chloroflexota bacterium]